MDSADAVVSTPARDSWLANLGRVLFRPRVTIRRILDQPRDRMVIPLFVLAFLSALFNELSIPAARQGAVEVPTNLVPMIVLGIVIGGLVMLLLFFAFTWWVSFIGKSFLEGEGTARQIRSAVAWGFAPLIWALLYRVPWSFFNEPSAEGRVPELPQLFMRGGASLAVAIIEIIVLGWSLAVTSATIGEAHRFSTSRGLAALLSALLIPVILLAAFILTRVT